MKKFVLLTCVLFFGVVKPKAQVVLNELYTDPNSGFHEFFELYNTSTSTTPFSLDNYTLITFFDISGQKGFYVMDLPNIPINPQGYFVGSSAIPFNFQGNMGSTASDFNWNSVAFTANSGYLKKWVQGTANLLDGNLFYDQAALPVNFNDFFFRRTANGASYTIFLYRNGQMINSFIGGTGGNATIINDIVNMPLLYVDMVNIASTDFTINFSGYGSLVTENCIQDAGSDNGYIRERDGACGLWNKSSASVQHTPKATNGGSATALTGSIAVSSVVTQGTAATGSWVTYDVVSAPAGSFPVQFDVYLDKGTVTGKLDAGDQFIETRTQNSLSDPAIMTHFFPYDLNVILVVKSAIGCIDKIQYLANAKVLAQTTITFQGALATDKILFSWDVLKNENIDRFELEQSTDGKDFSTAALVVASESIGKEHYGLYENINAGDKKYYRLKIINRAQGVEYSRILVFDNTSMTDKNILITNPVTDKLTLSFTSNKNQPAVLNIYDLSGKKINTQRISVYTGANTTSVPVTSSIKPGMYILELHTGEQRYTSRFIKQ